MNLEQAMTLTAMRKQPPVVLLEGKEVKTAKQMAEFVFEMSAAIGDPYRNAVPEVWAERWLASKKFVLVDIDPRQVAVPYVNRISRSKVMATMQASADAMPPLVVDVNRRGIGKTSTGYIPSVIVVDGKNRHRAQIWSGRDRVSAWVGEQALAQLQARAAVRKNFVVESSKNFIRPLSKVAIEAALMHPSGGSPVSVARQDTGEGGPRPIGSPHTPIGPSAPVRAPFRGSAGASSAGGPGGGVSGLNPERMGLHSDADPSDRGQLLDPSDKDQFAKDSEPDDGDPRSQSPGSGVGPRTRPSTGASNSEMSQKKRKGLLAGPIKVKKIVTDKRKHSKK